jgi:sugar O-acyltransferase (sialic acid O-acetyltransferase NeuD family)
MAYAVYGAGGFAREVAPFLRRYWLQNEASFPDPYEGEADIVFVDDSNDRAQEVNSQRVISFDELTSPEHRLRKVIVAIGSGTIREKIENECKSAGLMIATAFAPSSIILDEVSVGDGSVICDHVTLTSNITVGLSFQANLYSYVGHDCIIGDYVTFAPRVNCNGNVHIGSHVYVGTGASIIQGTSEEPLTIGDGAIIGMGAVVTKPVPARTLVAGNPARAVRTL